MLSLPQVFLFLVSIGFSYFIYQTSFSRIITGHRLVSNADKQFFSSWWDQTLEFAEWNHIAHVRACYLAAFHVYHDQQHAKQPAIFIDQVFNKMKQGINQYNAKHAAKLTIGYHETLTKFWVHMITLSFIDVLQHKRVRSFDDFLAANEHLTFALVFKYYSKDYLFSAEAKQRFVAPDLMPLPAIPTQPLV